MNYFSRSTRRTQVLGMWRVLCLSTIFFFTLALAWLGANPAPAQARANDSTANFPLIAPHAPKGGSVTNCSNQVDLEGKLAGGGTVTFSCSGTIPITSTLLITLPTTIDGAGQSITLDGQIARRIITATAGVGLLTIQNITLTKGVGINGGGALFVGGNLIVSNTTFTNNSTFGFGKGGGAYVTGTLTLTNTQLLSNTASGGGGAYALGAMTISGGRFENNYSNAQAGGLWADSTLVMSGTQFISNTANTLGGGAYVISTTVLNGGLFQKNTSVTAWGGALYADNSLTLTGTQFISNTTSREGGGAYVRIGATILSGGLFQNNQNTNNYPGGGLYAGTTLALTDTQFISNTAIGNGGGAYAVNAISMAGGSFAKNKSNSGGGVYGNSTLTLTGTQFISNTALGNVTLGNGGGLYIVGASRLDGGSFISNTASGSGSGGALFTNATLELTGTQFISNKANSGGGALAGATTLHGGLFQNNTAANAAGGMWASDTLTVHDTQFISNAATLNGGGAFVQNGTVLNGGLFQNNKSVDATGSGGGLYANRGGWLIGTQFISNTAGGDGGGAYVRSFDSAETFLIGGLYQNNVSLGGHGGGLFLDNTLWLNNSQFISNSAASGGGIYHNSNNANLVNALFARNVATSTLGAALYLNSAGSAQIYHTTIASPTLDSGSAIYVANGTVGITNTIITFHSVGISNTAGAVYQDYNLLFANTSNTGGTVGGGTHNVTGLAPQFVNPNADNYHLQSNSPAIDRGANLGISTDLEGNPRPVGCFFDIGAFEYQGTRYCLRLPLILR